MSRPTPNTTLDARGLFCPEPVMLLHVEMDDLDVGQALEVLATDPTTERDIPNFCKHLGHQLVEAKIEGEVYHYLIIKGEKAS